MRPFWPEADPPVAAALRRLLAPWERRWIVAVSGGADSIFLLHQCAREGARQGIRPVIVHVNHGLRGDEADEDEAFVRRQARTLRLPLEVVIARPQPSMPGNVAAQARHLRQEALLEAAGSKGLVLLGHHAGDQRETVLMGLLKGKGPLGSAGMRERQGPWVRPLLKLEGAWLRQRLARQGLEHREDGSNRRAWCERNHLRLALLDRHEPGAVEGSRVLDRLAHSLGQARGEMENLVKDLLDHLDFQPNPCGFSLERPTDLSYHEAPCREALRQLGRQVGAWSRDPSRAVLQQAARLWVKGQSGRSVPLGSSRLEVGRNRAWLVLQEPAPLDLMLRPGDVAEGEWGRAGWGPAPAHVLWQWIPAPHLRQVWVRRWRAGDRLPAASGRGPLLADVMGDRGFTPTQKRLQVLLVNEVGQVVASPGLEGPDHAQEGNHHHSIWMTTCPSPLTK